MAAPKGNPGPSGGGGIVRNEKGEMIIAYAMPLGIVTKNTAETLALKAVIEWCIDQNVKKLEIESDSLMLVQWLTNTTSIPLSLQNEVQDIRSKIELFEETKIIPPSVGFHCSGSFSNTPAGEIERHNITLSWS
ncbi:uncharacterized protein LOC142180050 [Nicotiana tabacum]|uniref:Uncharacterized protein LOC142180050 n=1 Tax=Nicotiana tabacum TaxID=4097 RepID=A0AC58UC71_TOBAC